MYYHLYHMPLFSVHSCPHTRTNIVLLIKSTQRPKQINSIVYHTKWIVAHFVVNKCNPSPLCLAYSSTLCACMAYVSTQE